MKRRFFLMGLAAAIGVVIASLPILTATATSADPTTGSFIASDFKFTAGDAATGTTTVTIAAGGTVDFSYPSGNSIHNVDFGSGPQPTSCEVGGQTQAPPIPTVATAPGWSGSCTFDTPGTYTFHCDRHPTMMTGTIIVDSPTSTTPTTTTTTPTATTPSTTTPTTPTMTMPMTMPMPGSATSTTSTQPKPSPVVGSARRAIKIIGGKSGGQVRGSIRISAAGQGGHALITVLASRAALRHGAPHSRHLVTLGRKRLNGLRPGTATFKVGVTSPARRALISYRRLAITIRVTVIAPAAKTVTLSRTAVLRA